MRGNIPRLVLDRAIFLFAYAEAGEYPVQNLFIHVLLLNVGDALVSGPQQHCGNFIVACFQLINGLADIINRLCNCLPVPGGKRN